MTREEFISYLESKKYSYHIEGESTIVDHDGDVWLSRLEALPPNVEFRNGGNVDLDGITILNDGIHFRNGGRSVWIGALKRLPNSVQFRNRSNLWLDNLRHLPLEDLDHVFQNTEDIQICGDWMCNQEFPESRWEST